jgi:hypothetical protein
MIGIAVVAWELIWYMQRRGENYLASFFAVVEQQLKKCTEDKLVLGCFCCLVFGLTAG